MRSTPGYHSILEQGLAHCELWNILHSVSSVPAGFFGEEITKRKIIQVAQVLLDIHGPEAGHCCVPRGLGETLNRCLCFCGQTLSPVIVSGAIPKC